MTGINDDTKLVTLLNTPDASDRQVTNAIAQAHPADLAEALQQLDDERRLEVVETLPAAPLSEVLPYLEDTVREHVVQNTPVAMLAAAVQELDTDDAVELIDDVAAGDQRRILAAIPQAERLLLEESLTFPDDSAGRLMQRDTIAVPSHWDVGETIDFLRQKANSAVDFYEVFLIDPRYQPVGSVLLSKLLTSKRPKKLADLAREDFKTVPVSADQEEVAYLFRKYGFISVPVVDRNGRLAGAITVDDVVSVIDEEAEEDILRLAGVGEHTDFYRGTWRMVRTRAGWLGINLMTAIAASLVIAQFDQAIEKLVALAVLLPIVASMGGNAGMQTLTVMVRAIAMRQVNKTNAYRVIGQEVAAGLINGVLFAVVGALVTWVWFGDPRIGVVLGIAMIATLLIASVAGALIPLGLKKVGADPAIASGVFLTTVTDVMGFFAFLGLAAWWLL